MADPRKLLAATGPEDVLCLTEDTSKKTGLLTSGRQWRTMAVPAQAQAKLDFTDADETLRLMRMARSDDGGGRALRELSRARYLCTKAEFAFDLCDGNNFKHQLTNCADAAAQLDKCMVKAARAVDILCRAPFVAYARCLDSGVDAAACAKQRTAFDICTEDF